MRMVMGQWSAQWSARACEFVYVSYIYNINMPLILELPPRAVIITKWLHGT